MVWRKAVCFLKAKLRKLLLLLYITGHCKVDETEKGWFIQYIDRDPETIERQKVTVTNRGSG